MKYWWILTLANGETKRFDAENIYPRMSIPVPPPRSPSITRRPYLSILSKWEPDLENINHAYNPDEWTRIELVNEPQTQQPPQEPPSQ